MLDLTCESESLREKRQASKRARCAAPREYRLRVQWHTAHARRPSAYDRLHRATARPLDRSPTCTNQPFHDRSSIKQMPLRIRIILVRLFPSSFRRVLWEKSGFVRQVRTVQVQEAQRFGGVGVPVRQERRQGWLSGLVEERESTFRKRHTHPLA